MSLPGIKTCLLLLAFAAGTDAARPSADPARWKAYDSSSTRRLDHGKWQSFLSAYLDTTAPDGIHRVRYRSVSAAHRKDLDAYLATLQAVRVTTLGRDEQKAFWINLYNAQTVAVVLERYPVKSILDIDPSGKSPGKGPWDAALLEVEGVRLSLNDVEHRILRPLWKDSRVHFALNCASLGCPNLSPAAYTAENLERQLERGARDFVNSRQGVSMQEKSLILSSIFEWYREDFGKTEKDVLRVLSSFAAPALKSLLEGHPGPVRYRYDWALNDAKGKAPVR